MYLRNKYIYCTECETIAYFPNTSELNCIDKHPNELLCESCALKKKNCPKCDQKLFQRKNFLLRIPYNYIIIWLVLMFNRTMPILLQPFK